ncbi:hypothetical protein B0T10DRAFT_380813, partial [Thelonectria olida]
LFTFSSAAERFSLLSNDGDFVFDFNQEQADPGMAFGRIDAYGMNSIHVHPRSAELQFVTSGRLITEMVPENGVLDNDGQRRVI